MAQFKPKKLNIESIHGGQKYAESRTPFLPSDVNEIIETLYGTSEGLRMSLRKASLLIPDDQIINIDLYEKNIIFPKGTIIVLNGKRKEFIETTVKINKYDRYFIVRFNTDTNEIETSLTVDDSDEYKNYYLFSVCYNTDGKPLTDLDVAYSLGGDSFKISNLTVRSSYNAGDASTTAIMTESAVADALKKTVIENQTDGLAYELSRDGKYYICKGIGTATDTDIIIASKVNGIPVTDISSGAFSNSIITSVIIPDSVTVIGDGAFFDCPSLTSVTLGNSVESIVENAFYYCQKLTNINLPESLIEIGGSAFWYCNNLKNIWIPKSVETIGYDAFNGSYNIYCEAESQPEDWDSSWLIGTSKVFWNVKSKNGILIFQETGDSTDAVMSQKAVTDALNNIPTSGGGSSVEIVQETGDSEEKVMSQNATTDFVERSAGRDFEVYSPYNLVINEYSTYAVVGDNSAVQFVDSDGIPTTTVEIPITYKDRPTDVIMHKPVVRVARNAFKYNVNIERLVTHDGLFAIEGDAFNGCSNLSSIVLANSIRRISYGAFLNCKKLTNIVLPKSLELLGKSAFFNAKLTGTITIPHTCAYIGENGGKVFNSKSISAIVFDGTPEYLHPDSFYGCTCDIYVPWSEGEVEKPEDSAWGSTGTVHYNHRAGSQAESVEVVQETGERTDAVMSQKSTTDALNGKLDKVTESYWAQRLYGVDTAGNQILHNLRWQPEAYSVAQRGDYGTLAVGTPVSESHATTKKYVDDAIAKAGGGSSEYTIINWEEDIEANAYDEEGFAKPYAYKLEFGKKYVVSVGESPNLKAGYFIVTESEIDSCGIDPSVSYFFEVSHLNGNSYEGGFYDGVRLDVKDGIENDQIDFIIEQPPIIEGATFFYIKATTDSGVTRELRGKLDKVTEEGNASRAYVADKDGAQKMVEITFSANNPYSMIAGKLAGGIVPVGTPTADTHAVPLGYANEHYLQKPQNKTSNILVPNIGLNGEQGTTRLTWTGQADSIPVTTTGGALRIGEPLEGRHATTKKYVDDKCDWQSGFNLNSKEYVIDIETPTFTLETENGDFNFTFFAQGVYLNSFYLNAGQSITINGIASSPEDSSSNYGYPSVALATISRDGDGNLAITNLVCALQGYTVKIDGATISVIASKN